MMIRPSPSKRAASAFMTGHFFRKRIITMASASHPERRFFLAEILLLGLALLLGVPRSVMAADALEEHTPGEWLEIARTETAQQVQWEAAHPEDADLYTGAGRFIVEMYGKPPSATTVKGSAAFITWWQGTGSVAFTQWVKDGFPMSLDRDHLIFNVMALLSASSTDRNTRTMFVNGTSFPDSAVFFSYFDQMKKVGEEAYRRGLSGGRLSRKDYEILRLYTPMVYSFWGPPYLPFKLGPYGRGMTAGDDGQLPIAGMQAPDFTLPRLESILKSPLYTDAYHFDYRRAFHSEITTFLLSICAGFEPIPTQERVQDGPTIRAKPFASPFGSKVPDCVRLSDSRGRKPVMLLFGDGIDGDCSSHFPLLEPLYLATKDRIDWYFIADDICDPIYWSAYYFLPDHGNETFQKALTWEERGQTAKMWSMRWSNLSIPILLDDMAQHVQIAYNDAGGYGKVTLVDKKGVTCLNTLRHPMPYAYIFADYSPNNIRYAYNVKAHCVIAENIRSLLDNGGVWTGKDPLIPDWQQDAAAENLKVVKVDATAGMLTAEDDQGRSYALSVSTGTRIVMADAPDVFRTIDDLKVGAIISCTYGQHADASLREAHFILQGAALNEFISYPLGAAPPWCPLIVTSVKPAEISGTVVPRSQDDMRGLRFWSQAGTVPATRECQAVRGWIDHPDQTLTFHLDLATNVIVDGLPGKASDIRVGDHLGVEFRPEQKADHMRPFFIFVYRFGGEAGGAP